MRRRVWAGAAATIFLALPLSAQEMHGEHERRGEHEGQMMMGMSHHEEQIGDFEIMRDKFLALADAIPEDKYDWVPMEGVRSVREVMGLMAAEGYIFPTLWGVDTPEGVSSDWGAEMQRFGAMSKAEIITEMEKAFDHLIKTTRGLEHQKLMSTADWFGTEMSVVGVIQRAAGDMHEHLGQAIAYARMNQIVPPWSG